MTLEKTMLALPAEPTCADLRTAIEGQLLALAEVDHMLAEMHRTLARHPERHASAHPLLTNLLEHRSQVAHRLGLAMASWVRAGGRLDLHSPDAKDRPHAMAVPGVHAHLTLPSEVPVSPMAQPLDADTPPPVSPAEEALESSSPSDEAQPPTPHHKPESSRVHDEPAHVPRPPPPLTPQDKVLTELLALVGPPRHLNTVFEVLEEVEGLEALTRPAAMSRWPLLTKPTQRALLAMAVARTRAVKDRGSLLSPGVRDRLKVVIATFPAYAKRHAPGYVNGLQLSHDPEGTSWRADGVAFWEQLQRSDVAISR